MAQAEQINPYESPAPDSEAPPDLPKDPPTRQWTTLALISAVCFLCQAIDPMYGWFSGPIAIAEFLIMAVGAGLFGLAIWGALAAGEHDTQPPAADAAAPGRRLLTGLAMSAAYWCFVELCRGLLFRLGVATISHGFIAEVNYLGYGLMALPLYRAGQNEELPERWKTVLRGGLFALNALVVIGCLSLLTQFAAPASPSALSEIWFTQALPAATAICFLIAMAWAAAVGAMIYLDRSEQHFYPWPHYLGGLLVPATALYMAGGRLLLFYVWHYSHGLW